MDVAAKPVPTAGWQGHRPPAGFPDAAPAPMERLQRWHHVLGPDTRERHAVQLYSDEGFLMRGVGRWIVGALENDAGAVVIATPAHATALRAFLASRGHSCPGLESRGRLIILDAERTLARFMVAGEPSPSAFAATVGPVLVACKAAGASGRVRAWGEMVDLLWKRGEGRAAMQLETLWGARVDADGFQLLCSYEVDLFDPSYYPRWVSMVAGHHTVLAAEDEAALEAAVGEVVHDAFGDAGTAALALMASPPESGPPLPNALRQLVRLRRLMPYFGAKLILRAGRAYTRLADAWTPLVELDLPAAAVPAASLPSSDLFSRLMAHGLPDDGWLEGMQLKHVGDDVHVEAAHACGPRCDLSLDTCLTAMKVEEAAWRQTGLFLDVAALRREGDRLFCRLSPWDALA